MCRKPMFHDVGKWMVVSNAGKSCILEKQSLCVVREVQHSVFSAVKVFFPLFLPLMTDLLAGQHISKSANYAVFATSTYMIQPCDMTQHQV